MASMQHAEHRGTGDGRPVYYKTTKCTDKKRRGLQKRIDPWVPASASRPYSISYTSYVILYTFYVHASASRRCHGATLSTVLEASCVSVFAISLVGNVRTSTLSRGCASVRVLVGVLVRAGCVALAQRRMAPLLCCSRENSKAVRRQDSRGRSA